MNTHVTTRRREPKHYRNWLVGILLALALFGIAGRLTLFGQSRLAGGDTLWRLTIDLTVRSKAHATAVQIHPPIETSRLRVIQRNLHHPGFRIRNWSEEDEDRRSIVANATASGQKSINAEFIIHHIARKPPAQIRKTALDNSQREKYLQNTDQLQLGHPLISQTLQTLAGRQTEQAQPVDEIFRFLQLFNASYNTRNVLNVPATLARRKASALDRSLAMVALCRAAGFPARLVTGVVLQEDIAPRLHYWTEVYQDEKWLAYDIQFGYRESVPANYLPVRRNGETIVQVLNGQLARTDYGLERDHEHPYLKQLHDRSILHIMDMTRLPLDARNELAILLLLPLGALITALCRHLVGVHSYGVFTPTLLALAAVYADPVTTMVIFSVVCALAIAGRSLFPAGMSRIPRLAIIFTLVAMIMTLAASVMNYLELGQGGKVVLLPIIILTSLIDRLYRAIEDRGLDIALRRLAWTLLIALICLPVVQFEALGHLLLQYPEVHFITLALFVLIATYKGKRLVSLPFIHFLAEPETEKINSKASRNRTGETQEQRHAP